MAGVVLHFQTSGIVLGQGAPVRMVGASLTIGRGPQNDLCLPDPNKVISKNHCAIETHGSQVVVIDLSTNGTFLNYAKNQIGPEGKLLTDGDILTIGSYELRVELVEDVAEPAPIPAPAPPPLSHDDLLDDIVPPAADDGVDFLDDLLGGGGAPVGPSAVNRESIGEDGLLPPLGEEDGLLDPLPETDSARLPEAGSRAAHGDAMHDAFSPQAPATQPIPDDWDDLLQPRDAAPPEGDPLADIGDPAAPEIADEMLDLSPEAGWDEGEGFTQTPAAPPPELPQDVAPAPADVPPRPVAAPTSAPSPAPPRAPVPTTAAEAAPIGDPAARAFLAALGAEDVGVTDAELQATMAQLGAVMATMIVGMREILMTRASIKSEFRIQQTMIGSAGNNPLKFSITPEQAIAALVRPSKGYLPAQEAAEQALDDIKAHEVAMMTAMEAALKGLLTQLSPEALESQMTSGGGLSGLLKGKKARYWDIYESMYARISDQAENDFHELFGREFARAYQAQTERLK